MFNQVISDSFTPCLAAPTAKESELTLLSASRAMHSRVLPICLLEFSTRSSQRIVFNNLAFGDANAINRVVVERR